MKLIDLTCPHCGAQLRIDAEKEFVYCEHCGARVLLDNEINHIQIDNAEEAGYRFEKGRQRARAEEQQLKRNSGNTVRGKTKKKHIWLWVLGWIIIFPLPLTILLLRKKEMNVPLKIGIIAAAWILYLIICFASGCGSNSSSRENAQDETKSASSAAIKKSNITEMHFSDTSDVSVKIGETATGALKVTLKNSFSSASDDLQFISEDSGIASIALKQSSSGKTVYYSIEGINPGETYVYVTSGDGSIMSERIKVVVPAPIEVENVDIEIANTTLAIDESIQAIAIISPADADNQEIVWTSLNEKVATVDSKGIITAISEGQTTIAATSSNGVSSTIELVVDGTKRLMNVKVTYPRDDDNNIGDEWGYITKLNDERVGRELVVSVGDKLNCYAKFTESDDNPDIGEASKTYTVTKDDILNGFTITMDLYVKENGGRNSGQSAHFTVTYSFSVKNANH